MNFIRPIILLFVSSCLLVLADRTSASDFSSSSSEITVRIAENMQRCFSIESTVPEDKIFLHFQSTSDGVEPEIDVTIRGPHSTVIFTDVHMSEHRILFRAHAAGVYAVCFLNTNYYNKYVTFIARTGSESGVNGIKSKDGTPVAQVDPLETSLTHIYQILQDIRSDQTFLSARERVQRETSESTNARVLWWSIAEVGILILMTCFQLASLKRCFGTRRQV